MDTSDSECFESADEDFHSDEEVTQVHNVRKTTFQEALQESPKTKGEETSQVKVKAETVVETSQCNIRASSLKNNVEGDSDGNRDAKSIDCISDVKAPTTQEKTNKDSGNTNENMDQINKSLISTNKNDDYSSLQAQTKKLSIGTDEKESSPLQAQTKKILVSTGKEDSSSSRDQTEKFPVSTSERKGSFPKDQAKNLPISTVEKKDSSWQDGWDVEDNLWDQDEMNWTPKNNPVESPEDKSPDMWENDEWETFEEPNESTPWGNWGFTSLLSTATHLTNQVSQGITNALETGMGIPNPEELAKIDSLEERQVNTNNEIPSGGFTFGNLVSGVTNITKFVESTGTKVISGGLDTLETIGKKTMEVLQEGDPGLKKKRALLKLEPDKPTLSQVLREAKESAEKTSSSQTQVVIRRPNYETLFDDHHGLVHLEALEMVSKQCEIRLKRLIESSSPETLTEIQETMDQVKELCELPEEEEDEQLTVEEIREKLESAVKELNVTITYERLISTWEETEEWLRDLKLDICDESELHQQAIKALAQITALAVEQYHKAGELLLIKEHRSTADEADSLVQLTAALTSLIGNAAAKFSEKLNTRLLQGYSNKEEVNGLITNVFYEAGNSSSYIQDAFHLLIPVLQAGAV